MGQTNKFDLTEMQIAWEKDLKSSSVFTRSDIDELKSHLIDIYEDMLEKGLKEEEAFFIAVKRLGKPFNWEEEFSQTNNPATQTRKTLLLIAGIILYYCSYYLSLIIAKLAVIGGNLLNIETIELIRINKLVICILLLTVLLIICCLFIKERFLINLLEKIQFRPRHAVYMAVLTLIFAIIERCLTPVLKHSITVSYLRIELSNTYMYFEYIYVILLIFGFVVLFIRHFRQTGSPRI